ncbi:hypothetical protein GEMRC1_011443 [Eukaryota sp. GEM-RC1]
MASSLNWPHLLLSNLDVANQDPLSLLAFCRNFLSDSSLSFYVSDAFSALVSCPIPSDTMYWTTLSDFTRRFNLNTSTIESSLPLITDNLSLPLQEFSSFFSSTLSLLRPPSLISLIYDLASTLLSHDDPLLISRMDEIVDTMAVSIDTFHSNLSKKTL